MDFTAICYSVVKQVGLLYSSAGEQSSSVPWLSCIGAESSHTAGVTVAVPYWYAHYTAHDHMSFLIYREKQTERATLTAAV